MPGSIYSNSITSWLIVECDTQGGGENSPYKPDEQPTQEDQDMNNNKGVYWTMIQKIEWWNHHYKNQITFMQFPSPLLPIMIAAV